MKNSEITLREAIENVDIFCPVKIIFNGIILYNDYDGDDIGECDIPLNVVPSRIWQFDKYIVTGINIEIIEFHHSIISMQGEYRDDSKRT